MAIVVPEDLYTYSIALRNAGITVQNIQMLEIQVLLFLFGKEGARKLIQEVNLNGVGSSNVKELIDGDDVLFVGLRAVLATVICTNLMSQNKMQVARQNVSKQPPSSRQVPRRDEADVVQSLAYSAKNVIYAMDDFLKQEGKNPLGLQIQRTIPVTRYSTNSSGAIPAARHLFMGFLPW